MTQQLGPFQIEHPFILAPMAGITNSPFRRLMRKMKSAIVISELVSANGLQYSNDRTKRLLEFHEEERIVGLQIFGEDGDVLANACRYVEKLGADFVDLNLGCPVPKIVKKGAGSAMCRNPSALEKILKTMVASVKIPVTIKIRTGWDADTRNAKEVVNAAAEAGVKWVAIHGRTRAQGYSGPADWDFIAEVKRTSPLPIIGNGDIHTAERAVECLKTYGVDAVMIGRGALRNPFIFEQAQRLLNGQTYSIPGPHELLELMHIQRDFLIETYEADRVLLQLRKFLAWYSSGYPGCHDFRRKIFSTTNSDELWADATHFFETVQQRSHSYLAQPFLMGGHG